MAFHKEFDDEEELLRSGGVVPLRDAEYGFCSSPKCKRKIIWVKGLSMPLDPVRVRIYRKPTEDLPWREGDLGYISHFKTCPDVGRFPGRGKK